MAADQDIQSPPYPNEGVNPDGLFNMLKALKTWVLTYRDGLNAEIGQDLVPTVRELPDKKAYTTQPIPTQWGHFLFIRALREAWDHLVRTYEDDWDDKACVRQRIMLVQSAAVLLNSAFTPFEHREARKQKDMEELQQMFQRIHQAVVKQMEHKRYDPEEGEAEGPSGG